jgi:hypothetical protein
MPTALKTKVEVGIGASPVDVLVAGVLNRFTIIGCNLANTAEENVTIDVFVVDPTNVAGIYIKGLIVPMNSSIKLITNGEKLIISENCKLRIVSNIADSIDAVISYAELT